MNIEEYIVPMISVGTYLIIFMVKPFFKSTKFIPLIAGLLGIALNVWASKGFDFPIFLEGLASGLGATGLDQLVKQTSGYYDVEGE